MPKINIDRLYALASLRLTKLERSNLEGDSRGLDHWGRGLEEISAGLLDNGRFFQESLVFLWFLGLLFPMKKK